MVLNVTAGLVLVLVTGAIGLARVYNDPWYFGVFAVAATAIVTFFGIIRHELTHSQRPRLTNSALRLAIASAVTLAYIVTVAFTMFIDERVFQPSDLSEQLVTSFTTIIAIVMAFFFGVSGYVDAQAESRKRQRKDENAQSDSQ